MLHINCLVTELSGISNPIILLLSHWVHEQSVIYDAVLTGLRLSEEVLFLSSSSSFFFFVDVEMVTMI